MVMFSRFPLYCWYCGVFFFRPMTLSLSPFATLVPTSSDPYMLQGFVLYFSLTACTRSNHVLMVCSLTVRPCLDSNELAQDVYKRLEYFVMKHCIHCFPTPLNGNPFTLLPHKIWSTCSFSLRWLREKPLSEHSCAYWIITSVSSGVSQDPATLAWAFVWHLFACRMRKPWSILISRPVSLL